MSHLVTIALRLKTLTENLLTDVQGDSANSAIGTVNRASQIPTVRLRKRRASRGREDEELMRINEGVTIVPMDPVRSLGTNDRDGVGYRFLIAIVQGTETDEIDASWAVPIWEQAIRRRFHNKRLGSLSLANGCELRTDVKPGSQPKWALVEGIDARFLVLTEYVRESRRD